MKFTCNGLLCNETFISKIIEVSRGFEQNISMPFVDSHCTPLVTPLTKFMFFIPPPPPPRPFFMHPASGPYHSLSSCTAQISYQVTGLSLPCLPVIHIVLNRTYKNPSTLQTPHINCSSSLPLASPRNTSGLTQTPKLPFNPNCLHPILIVLIPVPPPPH